jgi:hypothetical protein
MAQSFRPEVLVWGLSLIALGVLWTLGNLGALDLLTTLRRWWPSALVLWGALELAGYYSGRRERRS